MVEKYIPGISDYYVSDESPKFSELTGLRLSPEYHNKLTQVAKLENRKRIDLLRAIVMYSLDKIKL